MNGGARALADAILGRIDESAEDHSPMQGVVQSVDAAARTATVVIEGRAGTYSYGAYTPAVGDLVWIVGPSGAKWINDAIAGPGLAGGA